MQGKLLNGTKSAAKVPKKWNTLYVCMESLFKCYRKNCSSPTDYVIAYLIPTFFFFLFPHFPSKTWWRLCYAKEPNFQFAVVPILYVLKYLMANCLIFYLNNGWLKEFRARTQFSNRRSNFAGAFEVPSDHVVNFNILFSLFFDYVTAKYFSFYRFLLPCFYFNRRTCSKTTSRLNKLEVHWRWNHLNWTVGAIHSPTVVHDVT